MAGVLAAMGLSPASGEFVSPAEGPVAFRRDKLPLEAEAMADLSKRLEILARGLKGETAAERRGAAQMLALALALDPSNAAARSLLAEFKQGRQSALADAGRLERNRTAVRRYLGWLETPAAGSQGRALAACLQDILAVSEPKRPESAEAAEKGAWSGWIPELSAYEIKPAVTKSEPDEPPAKEPPAARAEIRLAEAQVLVPQWRRVGKSVPAKWELAVVPLRMSAKRAEPDAPDAFSIVVGSGQGPLSQTGAVLQRLLAKHHENLPRGWRIQISSKELEYWALFPRPEKRQEIGAAAAVLASAAVTGREPVGTIIGTVDESGAFALPPGFWNRLRSLETASGGRLVVPAAAAADLPSMLAMEKPGFFLQHEVLLAADFKELLAMSAKSPEGNLGKAMAKFQEIREKAGTQDVRQYIANRFVRQRLSEVLQEAPFHASARMLLIQASGNRPTLVSRPVLAAELRRAIEPMDSLVRLQISQLRDGETADAGRIFNVCREQVEQLERYAAKNDRGLVSQARSAVDLVRALDKKLRSRNESYMVVEEVRLVQSELIGAHKEIVRELDSITGDATAVAIPAE